MRFISAVILFFSIFCIAKAQNTYLVPSQYSSIQEAIDSSSNGDTIQIAAGTYYEYDITINKQVAIIGADSSTTILVDSTNSDTVRCFYITVLNVSIEDLTIKNYHDDEHGGAIYSSKTFDAKNVHFLNNLGGDSDYGGGAVHIYYGSSTLRTATFNGCRFTNNKSTSLGGQNSGGGALNIVGQGGGKDSINLTLISCVFELNETDQSNTTSDGGALYTNEAGIITISKCKFYDNRSHDKGSAIYARYSSAMNIENSLFYKNRVDDNATIFYYGTKGMFVNSTIADNISGNTNVSGLENHGTATQDGSVLVFNSIFWGNDYDEIDEGGPNTYETITVSYSIIDDNPTNNNDYTDSGNIVLADPLFSNSSNGFYSLQNGSPALGIGTSVGMPFYDIDGNTRINHDVGAYVTVCDRPIVSSQPNSEILCLNDVPSSMGLTAAGSMLSYQWYSNSSNSSSGGNSLGSSHNAQTDTISSTAFSSAFTGTNYYYCIVKNSCGADTSDIVSITVNTSLDLGGDLNICNGGNATIDAGSGYLDYDWNTGDSTQTITKTTAAEFIVTVTDSLGCIGIDTINIGIIPQLSQNDTTICLGDSLALGIMSTSITLSHIWSTGDSLSVLNTNPYQTTTYTVTISDGMVSCTDSVKLTVNPSIDLGNDINICVGGNTVIDAGNGFNVYDWSTGDSTQTITTLATGQYQVTVTDSLNCVGSDTINVGQLSEIAQSDTSLCGGNNLTLNVDSNTILQIYTWSTGDSLASITISPIQSAIFKVTVSDGAKNCYDSIMVSIGFPIVDLGADTLVKCNSDSFSLDAGSKYSIYSWNTGDSTQNINVSTTGTYEVSVTDSVSCQSSDNIFVNFLTADILESDTTICNGDTVSLNVNQNGNTNLTTKMGYLASLSGGNSKQSISIDTSQWHYIVYTKASNREGKIYINGQLVFTGEFRNHNYNYTHLYLAASYYTSWSQHYKGLFDEFRVSNTIRSESEISSYFASGLPFTSDVNTIGLWHFDDSTGNSFVNDVGGSGTLYNGVQFVNGKFGTAVSFDGIDDRGNCNLNIPENNITFEFWVKLSNLSNTTVIQPYGMYSSNIYVGIEMPSYDYTWSNNDSTSSISLNPSQTTNYTVSVSDGIGTCSDSVNISIQIPQSMLGNDTSICISDSLKLDAGSYNKSFVWSTGDSAQTIYADVAGTYKVTMTDSSNCYGTDSIDITNIPTPVASVSVTGDSVLCYGTTTTLSASSSGGTPPYTYIWDNTGELNDSTSLTPIASPLITKSYQILVIDSMGCKDSAVTNLITVREQFSAGLIDTLGEYVPYNSDPNLINELVPASGGSPPYSYLWLKNGSPLPGNISSYDPPQGSGAAVYTRYVDDSGSPDCASWTFSDGAWEVTIGPSQYSIYGNVFGPANSLLSNANVSLYDMNGSKIKISNTVSVDTNGSYVFYGVDSGRYLVRANANINLGVPTYYSNSFSWMGSQEIYLTSNISNVDINILELILTSGNGYISGNLTSLVRSPGDPIDSIVVGLTKKDSLGVYGIYTTDANGFFEFGNLDCGVYRVIPDITGVPVDTNGLIDIHVCGSDSSSVIYLVDSTLITIGTITSIDEVDKGISIYPNPVEDKLYIQSELNIKSIRIYNALGQEEKIFYNKGSDRVVVDIYDLSYGIYVIQLDFNELSFVYRFLKL